jgi:hypothetical protein
VPSDDESNINIGTPCMGFEEKEPKITQTKSLVSIKYGEN